MVWGAITSTGASSLCITRGTINAQSYIHILSKKLPNLIDHLPLSFQGKIVFQQDNARPHVARATTQSLQEAGIPVTNWPPLSPDLNPI